MSKSMKDYYAQLHKYLKVFHMIGYNARIVHSAFAFGVGVNHDALKKIISLKLKGQLKRSTLIKL